MYLTNEVTISPVLEQKDTWTIHPIVDSTAGNMQTSAGNYTKSGIARIGWSLVQLDGMRTNFYGRM